MPASGDLWLLYALGGGWGHLTRATALGRIAAATHSVRILTNSPYAAAVRERLPELEMVTLDPKAPAAHVRERAAREVARSGATRLIVDTFPRGLAGELAPLLPGFAAPRALVARDLNPRYVESRDLRAFAGACYDLILQPGPAEAAPLGDLPRAVVTAPWLIRSARELPSREAARALLGVGEQPCALVCASGNREELEWFEEAANALAAALPHTAVRLVAWEGAGLRYWPAMDLLPAATVVVAGAGYNIVNECAACRVPLIARAWPRLYDRQRRRAAAFSHVTLVQSPDQAAAAARRHLDAPHQAQSAPEYVNGAAQAANILGALANFLPPAVFR